MTLGRNAADIAELVSGSVFEVAERLIGAVVGTDIGGLVEVQIEEVEAYAGADDPASHAFGGRTPRNRSMFEPPGTIYVYRSYGIHWCMNVVVGEAGLAHAVLLRGGEVVTGRAIAEQRRGRSDHLTDGPGKLCQALGITGDHDGTTLFDGPISLRPGAPDGVIETTPRIGISVAKDRRWRYVLRSER